MLNNQQMKMSLLVLENIITHNKTNISAFDGVNNAQKSK